MHTIRRTILPAAMILALSAVPGRCGEQENSPAKTAAQRSSEALPVVVLLGDSIRMNYQKTVAAELRGKATVWSPKENGAHSLFTLQNLEKWVKDRNAAVVHINVGLHDLFLNSKTGQPRHSLEGYSNNLRKIFEKLKELTDAKIIFALTTPVVEQRQASSKTYKRVVRRNPDIVRYNRKAVEIAQELGVRIDDVHAVAMEAGVEHVITGDGVHLSKMGIAVIGKQVANSVLSALEGPAAK